MISKEQNTIPVTKDSDGSNIKEAVDIKGENSNDTQIDEYDKMEKKDNNKKASKLNKISELLFKHSILIVIVCVIFLLFLNYKEFQLLIDNFDISQLRLNKFFGAILFLIVVINLVKYIKQLLYKALSKRDIFDEGFRYSVVKITGYAGWIIAGWGAISMLGIKTENLAILVGALSVGVGFGLQHIVNNFMSGLIVLFERPIKKGDWILVKGQEGIVQSIRIRSTELRAFDGTSILIPNADILSSYLINVTHDDNKGRAIINVSVSYGTDLYKVRDLLLEIANAHEEVCSEPAPYVLVTKFGESGIDIELRVIAKDVNTRNMMKSDLMFSINDAFNKNNITIPFPQRELRITREVEKEL